MTELNSTGIWDRFKKSKTAVLSFIFILICFILAVFAYIIIPDSTSNANRQSIEIQAKNPGHTQLFLIIPSPEKDKKDLLSSFFNGNESKSIHIPINSLEVNDSSVTVMKYIDADTAVLQSFDLPLFRDRLIPDEILKTKTFYLGTDTFGRDIFSRLLIGLRISLAVGLISLIISMTLGIVLGAFAGYYRGKTDAVIMWLINITWSIPTLLLVIAISMALGKGFWQIFIALGLTMWVGVARLVRGQVIALKEQEYIRAAVAMGYKPIRIITRHVLPNISGPILVMAASNFATAIMLEAGLSFLGIGVQPPTPSWGLMLRENYNFIITNRPLLALIPGLAIMVLVLGFNLLGNGIRDAFDVSD